MEAADRKKSNKHVKFDIMQRWSMRLEKRPAGEEEWHLLRELESLGIEAKRLSGLNDRQELRNLVENIKQTMYQEYKTHYRQH
jgi:hypothetical protein